MSKAKKIVMSDAETVNDSPIAAISDTVQIKPGFIGLMSTKNPAASKIVQVHASMRRLYESNPAFTIIEPQTAKKKSFNPLEITEAIPQDVKPAEPVTNTN